MAYVKFDSPGEILPALANREPGDSPAKSLGRDEWSIVDFARNDGMWSLNPNGFRQRLVRILFGIRPPLPLANERLEALRRFAVIAWNKTKVRDAHMRAFAAAGFSSADADAVLAYVRRHREIQSWPRGIA